MFKLKTIAQYSVVYVVQRDRSTEAISTRVYKSLHDYDSVYMQHDIRNLVCRSTFFKRPTREQLSLRQNLIAPGYRNKFAGNKFASVLLHLQAVLNCDKKLLVIYFPVNFSNVPNSTNNFYCITSLFDKHL